MRLTRYTDYALRILIHLALEERMCSIGEIARVYDISHNHLMKVAHALVRAGFVETVRGRAGGMQLARKPEEISVGEVVRLTEDGFDEVECEICRHSPGCGLTSVLGRGMAAMLTVFDRYTIADLLTDKAVLRRLIANEAPLGIGHGSGRTVLQ
ncbi:MAG TPA: Rrf2 family transcriptional regulator [Sphingomonadaceae bacterium]|nr:Rrf2 family transcriptional regulator [Sphingomonadaceae bacterium]